MTHIVQFKVESTGVTHRLSIGVASPQCCCACVTVSTKCSCPLADNLKHRQEITGSLNCFLLFEYLTK